MKTKRTNLLYAAVMLLGMTLLTTSCEKEKPNVKVKAETKMIEAKDISAYDKWHYFSFSEGKFVGEGAADPKQGDDAKWKARTDWDIAFHQHNVRINSGTSGVGKGGILMLETQDFASVKEFSQNNFTVDAMVTAEEKKIFVSMPPVFVSASINLLPDAWYQYNHKKTAYELLKKNVFIVKTADGKYAKMQFTNILNNKDKGGFLSMKYAYQKDGTNKFE